MKPRKYPVKIKLLLIISFFFLLLQLGALAEEETPVPELTREEKARIEMAAVKESFARMADISEGMLKTKSYDLKPILENLDTSNRGAHRVVMETTLQVIMTILHSEKGRTVGEEEGRTISINSSIMEIVIIDFPEQVNRVTRFYDTIPKSGVQSKEPELIVFRDFTNRLYQEHVGQNHIIRALGAIAVYQHVSEIAGDLEEAEERARRILAQDNFPEDRVEEVIEFAKFLVPVNITAEGAAVTNQE